MAGMLMVEGMKKITVGREKDSICVLGFAQKNRILGSHQVSCPVVNPLVAERLKKNHATAS